MRHSSGGARSSEDSGDTMRLVYLHQYFNTRNAAGSTRSYEFARRFAARGVDVHMVTSARDKDAPTGWTTELVDGIKVHRVKVPYNQDMSFARRIQSFFAFAAKAAGRARQLRGDVVFATSTPLTISLPAMYATLGRKTPFVLEVRDLWPTVPIAMGALRSPLSRAAARCLEKLSYSRATAIIALSNGMRDGVVKVTPSKADVTTVIPNSSDVHDFMRTEDQLSGWSKDYPGLRDSPFILYAGSFGKVNNLPYLVDLAVELASRKSALKIVAVGDGSEKESVLDYAQERGVLGTDFVVMKPVSKAEIPYFYAAATLAISTVLPIPELEANSANKFFDALAAGVPILVNHGGWMADIIEQAGAGLVLPATNASRAAAEICDFTNSPESVEAARINARKLAVDVFDRDRLAEKLLEVLQTVDPTTRESSEHAS